ncbi:energy-coupling factor transporter transmembrane component T family protein [Anoxynatronum buryatiense]|uniref:Cobalt/nickel transport system permease protein n=1 Tax=Anoxynatronum buryatiense TaxID=489973 RepID=A0AA46AHK2_9CLOT|nr:energy-coupling factor transporter transmembrane component T [Anoxynatronum buryatiense]SMP40323.1 cobalt/nickel transport system permease protein [Anoxynatronum buryatiense]
MHLAEMDHLSVNGKGFFHRRGTLSKLVFTIFMLSSWIISRELSQLLLLLLLILFFFVMGSIPLKKVGHLALYPAFFSLIFALMMAQQSWVNGLVIILKAVGAALTMLLLIATTPYVDIFAALSKVLPGLLVDLMIFTYRAFFLLMEKMQALLRIIRLRGGYDAMTPLKNLQNLTRALGTLVIQAFEMSERIYQILAIRGYSGRIPLRHSLKPRGTADFGLMLAGMVILMGTVMKWNL